MELQAFKLAMSKFATGVTVVTTAHQGGRHGMTVSAFASVSLTPPLILVCIAHGASAYPALVASSTFAVNILGTHHARLGARFAGMVDGVTDRFEGSTWATAITGSPILVDCVAFLDCQTEATHEAGDHTIVIGRVLAADSSDREALLHYRRNWRAVSERALSEE
jgi:flavin reductase (DIM6/NTAB) family NADH-FMN oxidoreductase RutF